MTRTVVTEREYLEMDRASDVKLEYSGGEVFAMAGGTRWHSRIGTDVVGLLREIASTNGCEAFWSDAAVRTPNGRHYYPDASYACDPQFDDDERLLNPLVIVEVLSPNSDHRDRGVKLDDYRTIPSLRNYIILHSDRVLAHLFSRTAVGWILTDFDGRSASVPLEALNATLSLEVAYRRIPDSELRA